MHVRDQNGRKVVVFKANAVLAYVLMKIGEGGGRQFTKLGRLKVLSHLLHFQARVFGGNETDAFPLSVSTGLFIRLVSSCSALAQLTGCVKLQSKRFTSSLYFSLSKPTLF